MSSTGSYKIPGLYNDYYTEIIAFNVREEYPGTEEILPQFSVAVKGSMSLANTKGREGRKYQNILMKSWNIMVKNTAFLPLMLDISGP